MSCLKLAFSSISSRGRYVVFLRAEQFAQIAIDLGRESFEMTQAVKQFGGDDQNAFGVNQWHGEIRF